MGSDVPQGRRAFLHFGSSDKRSKALSILALVNHRVTGGIGDRYGL
jgi:hypothetical protein